MTVAGKLKNVPLQKVIGPGSEEVVNMDSFWATQVCLSFYPLCGDFPTRFLSHDKSALSASLFVLQINILHAVGFHTKAGLFCACRPRFCSFVGIPHA